MRYKYIDVYGRDVNVGDVVLCSTYNNVGVSGFDLLEATLNIVGSEKENLMNHHVSSQSVPEIRCYKIEDINISKHAPNFYQNIWYKYYNSQGHNFSAPFGGVAHTRIVEMLKRDLKPGDLILYGVKKTKVNYGLVIGANQILTDTGKVVKQNYGLLIENLIGVEKEIKAKLIQQYKELITTQANTKQLKSKKDVVSGGLYLTRDNKYLYVYIENCGYTIQSRKHRLKTYSGKYDSFFIQISTSLKWAKSLIDKIRAGKKVGLDDILSKLTLYTEEDKYVKIGTCWDSKFMEKLVPYGEYILWSELGYSWDKYMRLYYAPNVVWEDEVDKDATPNNNGWDVNWMFAKSIASQLYDIYGGKTKCLDIKDVKLKKGDLILGQISLSSNYTLYDNGDLEIVMNF